MSNSVGEDLVAELAQLQPGGRWQAYPRYKDSGVAWLGEIPEHWETWKLAHAFTSIGSGTTPPSTNGEYYEGDIPWVNTTELKDSLVLNTYNKITEKALSEITTLRLYQPGTLLVALYGATIGKVGILKISATINQACCALSGATVLDTHFTFYWFLAHRQLLISLASGGGQPNINQDIIRSLRIPTPPLFEQRIIATFLDYQTANVDALITKKEQHVALLQEKRTALISQAVTKGLDPTAALKDSEVEWLGMIPEHWEVRRLKFVANVLPGVAKGRDLGERDTIEMPYLRVANVQDGYLDLSDIATITVGVDEVDRYLLQPGDVLMNEGGDFDKLGRGYVWDGMINPCLHQNHVFAVRPHMKTNAYWINIVTQTLYAKHYFILKSKQSTNLASISGTNLKELPILLPPIEERSAIMNYISTMTGKIDALIARIREGIEKVKEYRIALISAAVTGKIDVCNGQVGAAAGEQAI